MRRRNFILLAASAAIVGPRLAGAQSPSKTYRVGTLTAGLPLDEKSPDGAVLLKVLEQHGYVPGKNLAFEARGAAGQIGKLGEIIRAMKADGVDLFVTSGFPATLAPAGSRTYRRLSMSALAIRSPLISSTAWLVRAATSPGFRIMPRRSPASAST